MKHSSSFLFSGAWYSTAILFACLSTSCSQPTKLVVGSKSTTEQLILGEITAQHLQHRLGDTVKIERRFAMGDTIILNQALINGDVDLYPEDIGLALTQILHEQEPPSDPVVAMARVKAELARTQLVDVLNPFGFDNHTAIVVAGSTPEAVKTLSQAGETPGHKALVTWNFGSTLNFVSRESGLAALNGYRIPMSIRPRTLQPNELFTSLQKGEVSMIATQFSDAHLLSDEWRVLEDDLHVFPPRQTALLVRQEAASREPRLKTALLELSGKIDIDAMRKLNAQVDLQGLKPADVAAKFLETAGLK